MNIEACIETIEGYFEQRRVPYAQRVYDHTRISYRACGQAVDVLRQIPEFTDVAWELWRLAGGVDIDTTFEAVSAACLKLRTIKVQFDIKQK